MYLPFGDYWHDGHGQYVKVLVNAPSLEHPFEAQKRIIEKYGKYFFEGMADDYQEPCFSPDVWEALIETNYPIERLAKKEDNNEWEKFNSIQEALKEDNTPYLGLDFVIDAFIWLLNAYGAEITVLEDYPVCDIKMVGYGCFY